MKSLALALLLLCVGAEPAKAQDDPTFALVSGAYLTAAMADLATSQAAMARGGHEVLLGAGLENRPVAFGLLKGGLAAGTVYLLYRVHRHRPKTAFWLGVALTSVEITAVSWNARQLR